MSRFPPPGRPGQAFPDFDGTIKTLRLPDAHFASLRFLRSAIPKAANDSFCAPLCNKAPDVIVCQTSGQGLFSRLPSVDSTYIRIFPLETTGSLKFPQNLICTFAHAPATPDGQTLQTIHNACVVPACLTTKTPTRTLSRLNNMAFALAVYASQCRLPDAHARLAPGCSVKLGRQDFHPQRFQQKVSAKDYISFLLANFLTQ